MLGGKLLPVAITVAAVGFTSSAHAASLTDGKARFTVITPSLVRLQYAQDGAFQDGHTQLTDLGCERSPLGRLVDSLLR